MSIKTRVDRLEKALPTTAGVPPGENHVVVYQDGPNKEVLIAKKLAELRIKYGQHISEKDLLVIKVDYYDAQKSSSDR